MVDKYLCDRVKEIRKHLRLTQKEFAEKVGTEQSRISSYENYREEPSKSLLIDIIRKTNIDGTWLLTGEGTMFRGTTSPSSGDGQEVEALKKEVSNLKKEIRTLEAQNKQASTELITCLKDLAVAHKKLLGVPE